jgi:cob(I)alamin adenosyltransferase
MFVQMKIYTKTGDDGSTGLIGGSRVSKGDLRIDCYGNVDELNACLGFAAAEGDFTLIEKLRPIQNELFVIGSLLATPEGKSPANVPLPQLDDASIARLEQQIDAAEALLPPLHNFILPGGTELSCRLHLARTICRRAERAIVSLAQAQQHVDLKVITYLNRLSDWLFVHARLANHLAGVADIPWTK